MSNKSKTTKATFEFYNSDLVSVIASFDTEGHIRPLYVRIGEESYKVHSSWLKPSFDLQSTFQCQVMDGQQLKPLVLTYHQRESVWTIYKDGAV